MSFLKPNKKLLQMLISNKEVAGYESPSGKITFQKHVNNKSFSQFVPIIRSIVPMDTVYDPAKNRALPSIARVLPRRASVHTYPRYLFVNATLGEYMDYEDEEDQENMDALLEYVCRHRVGEPTLGIVVQKSEAMQSAHAIAFVAWRTSKGAYRFAFYDSLAYRRGEMEYEFSKLAFRSARFPKHNITFMNLSNYCYQKPGVSDDFHCTQYVINADYCYIYALFFLWKWVRLGKKLTPAFFKKVVKATYVVKDASRLTRATTKESMIYRVVIMSFLCTMLTKYLRLVLRTKAKNYILDAEKNIDKIQKYVSDFENTYGTRLVKNKR